MYKSDDWHTRYRVEIDGRTLEAMKHLASHVMANASAYQLPELAAAEHLLEYQKHVRLTSTPAQTYPPNKARSRRYKKKKRR